jgi:hypothetical protein
MNVESKNLFIQELMFMKVQKIEHLICDRIFYKRCSMQQPSKQVEEMDKLYR